MLRFSSAPPWAQKKPRVPVWYATPRVFRVFVFTLSTLGVAYQHRYQQVVFENQAVKLLQPMERLNIIWIIIIEIILTACAELPTPWELLGRVGSLLSVYQIHLCGHSNRHQVMDQKLSFFICPRVSARFLHCFCTVSRDAMGTLTCKIRQRAQKLPGRKSRCFAQK